MRMTLRLLIFFAFIYFSFGISAQEQKNEAFSSAKMCINTASEKNHKLIDTFVTNKDPLKKAFKEAQKSKKEPPPPLCDLTTGKSPFLSIEDVRLALPHLAPDMDLDLNFDVPKSSPPAPLVRRECIAAAMQRAPGNDGYICRHPTSKEVRKGYNKNTQGVKEKYGLASGDTLQCVNKEMVDYMYFSVNSAIQCLSPSNPIDSRVIFRKFNNETAFNPTIAWSGGVGLGQMTSPAVKEFTTSLGNGKDIFTNVASSQKKACVPFKHIAQKDLETPPTTHSNNYCSWVNSGDGLARSLLFSISYYVLLRDHYILPLLTQKSKSLARNTDVLNALTAVGYGHEGYSHARWLIQKYRVNNKTNPSNFLKMISKNSLYLTETNRKMREVSCQQRGISEAQACDNLKLSEEELRGDSCISDLSL